MASLDAHRVYHAELAHVQKFQRSVAVSELIGRIAAAYLELIEAIERGDLVPKPRDEG